MSRLPIAVLKFGSSVLRSPDDLPRAVGEIYRFSRRGFRVVAVVSAFAGRTDRLFAAVRARGDGVSETSVATYVATGEIEAATLLAAELDATGIANAVFDTRRLGLVAHGSALDAAPIHCDVDALHAVLGSRRVAVVTGFSGIDAHGEICLLGRGGSDLTAIFLATTLEATTCRLLKDTEGLFESDPALAAEPPRRYTQLTFADAARIESGVVQEKARLLSSSRRTVFEVANPGSLRTTWVGAATTRLEAPESDPRPLRVLIAGLGTVGRATLSRLLGESRRIVVGGVFARENSSGLSGLPAKVAAHHSIETIPFSEYDAVIECLGGDIAALDLVERALDSGVDVVTANKLLLARHGIPLGRQATSKECLLLGSASVGGVVPMLETIAAVSRRTTIRRIRAIVNATTNFVLDRRRAGCSLESALAEARRLGLAEREVESDLTGLDAAAKAVLLLKAAFGEVRSLEEIPRAPFDFGGPDSTLAHAGRIVRQVIRIEREGGGILAIVGYEALEWEDPLAAVVGSDCGIVVEGIDGSIEIAAGRGAGGRPTAEAVTADVLDLYRLRRQAVAPSPVVEGVGLAAESR